VKQNNRADQKINTEGRKRTKKLGGFCPPRGPSQAQIRRHPGQKRLQEPFLPAEVPSLAHPQLGQPGNPMRHH